MRSPFGNPEKRPNTVPHGQTQYNNPFGNMAAQFMGGGGQGGEESENSAQAAMQKVATEAMTNYALGQVRTQYEEHKSWFSWLSFDSIKIYFDVTNSYVLHKLKIILFPFLLKENEWRRGGPVPTTVGDIDEDTLQENAPRNNLQAPDLYIPLMSFVTYLLITGFYHGQKKEFDAAKISYTFSKLLFCWMFESLIQKGFMSCLNFGNTQFLEIVCLTGYKFVILCIVTMAQIQFGTFPSYGVMCVFGTLFCYFFYMSIKRYQTAHTFAQHAKESGTGLDKKTFQLANSGFQFALIWFLSYN